jgi:hypothetical protein
VGCAMTGEVVALHGTSKALTDRSARHVDLLAGDKVARGEFSADFDEVVFGETRNSTSFAFGSTLAAAKWPRIALDVFFTLEVPAPS